jgi:hypothetical protein
VKASPKGTRLLRRAAARRIETIDAALALLDPRDRESLEAAGPALLRLVDALAEVVRPDPEG